ncbi:MAG: cupin domain-containing protein [Myxococcales bacterium]|nr:cupin domain-containing protein [Myxococcales bacterium]
MADDPLHAGPLCPEALAAAQALGLRPHPEGGLYRETFRAPLRVAAPRGERAASTAVYFLLPAGGLSALHRVAADEVWHHYDGDAVDLHTIDKHGVHAMTPLGRDLAAGERPQRVVPAGSWQAAIAVGPRYALCGCTVAPGFEFDDFDLPSRAELARRFPQHEALLARLTRS